MVFIVVLVLLVVQVSVQSLDMFKYLQVIDRATLFVNFNYQHLRLSFVKFNYQNCCRFGMIAMIKVRSSI